MWELAATILVPLLKWIFERIAKKKLDDKQFMDYISAHQKRRSKAGETAQNWEDELRKAQAELDAAKGVEPKKEEVVFTPQADGVPDAPKKATLLENLARAYKARVVEAPGLKAITLAQWMLESGRATSELATKHINFAGLKWREEMKAVPGTVGVRYEAHDGSEVYCKFTSIENFITGYWAFINRSVYNGWRDYKDNPKGFLDHLVKCGYCPDKGYADKVYKLLPEAEGLLK